MKAFLFEITMLWGMLLRIKNPHAREGMGIFRKTGTMLNSG